MLKEFPEAPAFKKIVGPSFVILGLGLGSGEIILWPYLVANYGLGIAWGALLGITFQFFINMEIERYALLKGESVFVGIAKVFRGATWWFIFSTFIGFGLPGIVAASAKLLATALGLASFKYLAMGLLVLIGLILSFGKTVYGLMEKFTMTIIFIGVPIIFALVWYLADAKIWAELFTGFIGMGQNYYGLPVGISLATFLGAFAYAGAGGNLNLTQSIYIREKGYGMGLYSSKLAGLFRNKEAVQDHQISGHEFESTPEHRFRFKRWWKLVNLEHFLVFWLTGLVAMSFLMVLSRVTVHGGIGNYSGINFVINQATVLGEKTWAFLGTGLLIMLGVMLFQTQLTIMDSTSRIMSENAAIIWLRKKAGQSVRLGNFYFIFVWAQIVFGLILLLGNIYEPKSLIVAGAVINAICMFVHIFLLTITNHKLLGPEFRPAWWRKVILLICFVFFGFFGVYTLFTNIFG